MVNEMNFMDSLKRATNFTNTENGAIAHKSTLKKVYDLFALGGAYRPRPGEDCILLFKNAFEEDETLALKCLFYLRDIRGGQGERRFFRVCFNWLARQYPDVARRNLINVAEYGRYDDLYCVVGTPVEKDMFDLIATQLKADIESLKTSEFEGVSLLAKWLKSENASSKETKYLANKTRVALKLTHKAYRQLLSALRKRSNVLERLMSNGEFNKIEYAKIPSRAGFIYRNAFAKRDAERYKEFINSKTTKVNAGTLYPYDMVKGVTDKLTCWNWEEDEKFTEVERETLNKYWANKTDYLKGANISALGVIDTSGSMDSAYGTGTKPIDVAISIGMYLAEGATGPFANHFISFASRPQLIEVEGIDFVDKVRRIYKQNLVDSTNLRAAFDLIKNTALTYGVDKDSVPNTLIVVSDMEIDRGSYWRDDLQTKTEMEKIRAEWAAVGLKMPHLVYWNVCARNNIILDNDEATYVSGCSPVIFECILTGKTGWDLCYEKLMSARYEQVK